VLRYLDKNTYEYKRRSDVYTSWSTQLPLRHTENPGNDRGNSDACGLLYQMHCGIIAWQRG
jgi:hypothetical protein